MKKKMKMKNKKHFHDAAYIKIDDGLVWLFASFNNQTKTT